MDALIHAALQEVGLPSKNPAVPQTERSYASVVPDNVGGAYTVSALRKAARTAKVGLYREERQPQQAFRRFYVDRASMDAIPEFFSPSAQAAELEWVVRRKASHQLHMAAAYGLSHPRAKPVALPNPTSEPDGHLQVQKRLQALSPFDRQETLLATRHLLSSLPNDMTEGLRRAELSLKKHEKQASPSMRTGQDR